MEVAPGPGRLGRISANGDVKEGCSRQKEGDGKGTDVAKCKTCWGNLSSSGLWWGHIVEHQVLVRQTSNALLTV